MLTIILAAVDRQYVKAIFVLRQQIRSAMNSFGELRRRYPMFKEGLGITKIYIACGYTDLRYGVDGLAALIQYLIYSSNISNLQNVQRLSAYYAFYLCTKAVQS